MKREIAGADSEEQVAPLSSVLSPISHDAAVSERIRKQALALYATRQYDRALKMAEKSVQAAESALDPDHPAVAKSLNVLGGMLFDQRRYDDAETCFRRSLGILECTSGSEHPDLVQDLNNLALLYRVQHRYTDAKLLLERALAIQQNTLGPKNEGTARSINSLALVYHSERNYDEAEKLYRRALAIRESTPRTQPSDVAESLNNLAALCSVRGDYSQAEALYVRSLEMHRHMLTLENLAACQSKQGRDAEAETLLKEALDSSEKTLGPEHPDVLQYMKALASFYDDRQMYGDAEQLHKRALAIQDKARGTRNSLKAKLRSFVDTLRKMPRFRAAMRRFAATAPRVRALVAHADVDNSDDLERLLAPMPHPEELRRMLAAHTQGHYWVYDEASVVARYIWSTGKEVVVFSLIDLPKDQAVRVEQECAKMKLIDQSTFRAAVMTAISVEL